MQKELAQQANLSKQDLQQIEQLIGKKPTLEEQTFFASLKQERSVLRRANLFTSKLKKTTEYQGHRLLDIGNGQWCTVQARAYAGPIALVQQESAANLADTYREQLALGVRPLGNWQALGFGNLERFTTQQAIDKTLDGTGQINHQMGIPNLGGSLSFHPTFNQNVLVNSFSIGVIEKKSIGDRSNASAGAALCLISPYAIERSNWTKVSLLPNPLAEMQLMEAALVMYQSKLISAMYTLTDGGLAGALMECSQHNNLGVSVNLDSLRSDLDVPSFLKLEFPASMLVLLDSANIAELRAISDQEELEVLLLGELKAAPKVEVNKEEQLLVELDLAALAKFDPQPNWLKGNNKPERVDRKPRFNFRKSASSKSYINTAKSILKNANTFDPKWMKAQSDSTVQMNHLNQSQPSAASLIRIKGRDEILAFSCDINPRYTQTDPYYGTMLAVAEATRNIIISGAKPIATVATMNFGNPNDKRVAWQIQQSLKALQEVTHKLHAPLLDMDWSLGHQGITRQGAIPIAPMPVIGILGILPDEPIFTGIGFREEDHLIYMIGTPHNDINASVYLKHLQYDASSSSPVFDLDEEYHIQLHLHKLIHREMIASAHDITEGGLFVALLESAAVNGYGFSVETDTNFRKDAYLFGEHQSRVVISLKPEREDDLVNYLNAQNVPFTRLGEVTGDQVWIDNENFGPLDQWVALRTQGMHKAMK